MPKTVHMPIPQFLQKLALEHGLVLQTVVSTKYRYYGEKMTFCYISDDNEFVFIFGFSLRYYNEDKEVFKVPEELVYVKFEAVEYDSKVLEFDDSQLKDATIRGLSLLIEEFMRQK